MKPEDIAALMESLTVMTEALSGMRNRLIKQGFSEPAAEAIVLQFIKGTSK